MFIEVLILRGAERFPTFQGTKGVGVTVRSAFVPRDVARTATGTSTGTPIQNDDIRRSTVRKGLSGKPLAFKHFDKSEATVSNRDYSHSRDS